MKPKRPGDPTFPHPDHDHTHCTADLMERASRALEAKSGRLTDLRRRVLEEIASSHKAVGAYDLIDRLARRGQRLAPISVYRALDALSAIGAIHRIESRNAFFACHARHDSDEPRVVLVCEGCLSVAEVASPVTFTSLADVAQRAGFATDRRVVELAGFCQACRTAAGADAIA
jgi:Fur family zinc uptake transcriptional regulator